MTLSADRPARILRAFTDAGLGRSFTPADTTVPATSFDNYLAADLVSEPDPQSPIPPEQPVDPAPDAMEEQPEA